MSLKFLTRIVVVSIISVRCDIKLAIEVNINSVINKDVFHIISQFHIDRIPVLLRSFPGTP